VGPVKKGAVRIHLPFAKPRLLHHLGGIEKEEREREGVLPRQREERGGALVLRKDLLRGRRGQTRDVPGGETELPSDARRP